MAILTKVNKQEAINIMERNLRELKECNDSDTFLLLSYDLEENVFMGRSRVDKKGGTKLIKESKTCILNRDMDEDPISILSMYTELQKDIYHITPIGEKHDMILIP